MTRWRTRAAGVLVAAAVATVPAVTGLTGLATQAIPAAQAAPTAPEPVGDCTTTSGVVVAVDFAHWGGPVFRSCGTTPTSAYTLLNQGGWHTTGTEHDGPGFICRIGYAGFHGGTQYPTPATEACVLTPPASAYWAFWYANRGQDTWNYSQAGAMGTTPEPGSVELWVFGSTTSGGTSGSAVPTVSPASLRATNTGRPPTVKVNSSQPKTTPAPAGGTSPATTPAAPGHSRPAGGGAAASTTPAAAVQNAQPTAASSPAGHGSAVPAVIALVIVAGLVVIGIVAAARRPRREH